MHTQSLTPQRSWRRRGAALVTATVLAATFSVGAFAAPDASIDQVYQAAAHGQMAEAQQMMAQVLKDHPRSGKAHYVEAELLARQGQIAHARAELTQAEQLAPGLPFAQPAAVSELRAKLASHSSSLAAPAGTYSGAYGLSQPAPTRVPWGWIIAAVALAGLGFAWWRARQQQTVVVQPYGGYGGGNYGGAAPMPSGPYPGYGGGGMGCGVFGGNTGGGLGSQMMGGLATGAAVGAGMIAGEALMHRVLGDDERRNLVNTPMNNPVYNPPFNDNSPDPNYDMGGNDFGLNDAGSWDDGGGSVGGDDWN